MTEEINEIIEWYINLPPDYQGVNDLIYQRQMLVGYAANYSMEVGTVRKAWSSAEVMYETKRAQFEVKEYARCQNMSKAKAVAKANTSKFFKVQKEAEGLYYSMIEQLRSIRCLLDAMSQHIAHSRDELKASKFGG